MNSRNLLLITLVWVLSIGQAAEPFDTSWEHYGADPQGRRFSPHGEITPDTVGRLKPAWTFRTGDLSDGSKYPKTSRFKATPIYIQGLLVVISGFNRVYALDPSSGELRWRYDPEVDFSIRYS